VSFDELLLFVHILAGITWVGGSIMLQIFSMRAVAAKDAEETKHFMSQAGFLGLRVFMPAGIIIAVVGIWLVTRDSRWDFDQFWISFALTIVIISALLGIFFYPRQIRKVEALQAAGKGPADLPFATAMRTIGRVSLVETLFLLAVVWAMVVKPGA